eukprot:jgi/Chrpa1/11633/Chrysochromulina_OHIO_Genome00023961-RA
MSESLGDCAAGGVGDGSATPHLELGSSRWIVLSFFFASLILSLSHAALAAVLAVAPALLGERLGSVACGTLFVAWVLSSLVAPYYMRILRTPRRALLTGLAGNVCYLGGMCAACYFYSGNSASSYLQWAFAIGAALVGGAGNGPLFVGQSCCFARAAAELDAQARRRSSGDRGHGSAGSSTPESRAMLSALFATTYLVCEVCLKLFAWVLQGWTLLATLVTVASACLLVGGVAMRDASGPALELGAGGGVGRVAAMLVSDPQAALALVGYNLCYGYGLGYEGTVLLARGVSLGPLGLGAVGPASAMVAAVAALAGWPLSFIATCISKRWGRGLVALVAGSCCYAGVAALVLQTGSVPLVPPDAGGASVDSPVATHAWGSLVQLQLLFGLSRAAWESVGVALTVEWFGTDDVQLSAAFAARLLFDGLGGAAGFFLLPSLSTAIATYLLAALAAMGALGLIGAAALEARKHDVWKRDVAAGACAELEARWGTPMPSEDHARSLSLPLASELARDAAAQMAPHVDGDEDDPNMDDAAAADVTHSEAALGAPGVERSSSSLLSLSAAAGLARTASLLVWDLPPRSPGILAGRRAVAVVVLPSGLARGSSFLEASIRQCE